MERTTTRTALHPSWVLGCFLAWALTLGGAKRVEAAEAAGRGSLRDYVARECPAILRDLAGGALGSNRLIQQYPNDLVLFNDVLQAPHRLRWLLTDEKKAELRRDFSALNPTRSQLLAWIEKLSCIYRGISEQSSFMVPEGKDFSVQDAQYYTELEIRYLEINVSDLIQDFELAEHKWQKFLSDLRKELDGTLGRYLTQTSTGLQRRTLYGLQKEYYRMRLDKVGVFRLVLRDVRKPQQELAGNKNNIKFTIQENDPKGSSEHEKTVGWHRLEVDGQLYFYLLRGRQKISVIYPEFLAAEKEIIVDTSPIKKACESNEHFYDGRMLSYLELFVEYEKRIVALLETAPGQGNNYKDPKIIEVLDQWEASLQSAKGCVARSENVEVLLRPIPWYKKPWGIALLTGCAALTAASIALPIYEKTRPEIINIQ